MGYAIIIAALIAAIGSVVSSWLAFKTRSDLRVPSGGTIGEVVERAHHQSAVNTGALKALVDHTRGVEWPPPTVQPVDEPPAENVGS
jgi:hypothetical protein